MDRKHIAFVWQGISGRYGIWKDGLWSAMQMIEKTHDVTYHEPTDDIPEDAIVLYWEAPCTILGKDSDNYKRIQNLPNKKALLFAGGRIEREWLNGFDWIFVESKINDEELNALDIPHSIAFGINEQIFYPEPLEKAYDGMHHGTCASWKRQWLVGESVGSTGLVVGRFQETDSTPFNRCKELGTTVLAEKQPEEIRTLINQSWTCLQTSEYWGGGQRCTLEALACNVPVICMTDSPKNREYVEESGCGLVVEPNAQSIRDAVAISKSTDWGTRGRDYVFSKWTSKHYANNLLKWINQQ
jgi:glycosyltransferase involved in cell wall biosynthesis